MNELLLAQKWIYDKLSNDGELGAIVTPDRIFANQAPEDPIYPIIIYAFQGGFDTRGLGVVRIQTNPLFQVKVICYGAPDESVRAVAHRIDELFQTAVTEPSEEYIFSSRREEPISYPEPMRESSRFYTHLGGIFRLVIYPEALGV